MSYRSLTSVFNLSLLSLVAVAACSADSDDPYSGAPAEQVGSGTPRNVDGPIPVTDEGMAGGGMGGGAMGVVSDGLGGGGMGGGAMGVVSDGMGGGAMGDPSPAMDVEVCDAVADVFQVSCAGGGCHSPPGATIGDFAAGTAEAEAFVDVSPILNASCGPMIDTADPLNSAILRKTEAQPCGGQPMPPSGAPISATQRACLEDWLSQF